MKNLENIKQNTTAAGVCPASGGFNLIDGQTANNNLASALGVEN